VPQRAKVHRRVVGVAAAVDDVGADADRDRRRRPRRDPSRWVTARSHDPISLQARHPRDPWHGMAHTLLVIRGLKPSAPRHWAVVVIGLAIPSLNLAAAEVPSLVLPLGVALALGVSAADAPREKASPIATLSGGRRHGRPQVLGFLPDELHIPDGYDEEYGRPIKRWAKPIDRDKIVSFDLFRHPQHGWMASVAYDQESRGPYAGSGDVFGIKFER
jgi:hypothetical protein